LTPTSTLTANRTITFPDLSGTVAVSSTAPITLSSTGVIGLTTPLAISYRWNGNKFHWICRFSCLFKRNNLCFHFSRNCRPTLIIRRIWRSNLGNTFCTTYGGTGQNWSTSVATGCFASMSLDTEQLRVR
jgi:hypothetical protein